MPRASPIHTQHIFRPAPNTQKCMHVKGLAYSACHTQPIGLKSCLFLSNWVQPVEDDSVQASVSWPDPKLECILWGHGRTVFCFLHNLKPFSLYPPTACMKCLLCRRMTTYIWCRTTWNNDWAVCARPRVCLVLFCRRILAFFLGRARAMAPRRVVFIVLLTSYTHT